MDFKVKDPKLVEALNEVNQNPELICDYLINHDLLVGLLVDKEEKKLVISSTENFKALAVFSTEESLRDFAATARPAIFSGKEIAELALKSDSRLLHLDPPMGLVINGSKLKAIASSRRWLNPQFDQFLLDLVNQQVKQFDEVSFELASGEWTDLRIILRGDFQNCSLAASNLGQFLHKDPKVIELLPSGADIVYSS